MMVRIEAAKGAISLAQKTGLMAGRNDMRNEPADETGDKGLRVTDSVGCGYALGAHLFEAAVIAEIQSCSQLIERKHAVFSK